MPTFARCLERLGSLKNQKLFYYPGRLPIQYRRKRTSTEFRFLLIFTVKFRNFLLKLVSSELFSSVLNLSIRPLVEPILSLSPLATYIDGHTGGESLPPKAFDQYTLSRGWKNINQAEAENQLKGRGKIITFGTVCSDSIRNTLPLPDSLRNTLRSIPLFKKNPPDFTKYPTLGPSL